MSSISIRRTPINPCKQIGFLKTKIPELQSRLRRLQAGEEIWIQGYGVRGKEVPKPKQPKQPKTQNNAVAGINFVGAAIYGLGVSLPSKLTITQAQRDLQNVQKNLIKQNQECNEIIQKYGSNEAYEDHLIKPRAIESAAYKIAEEKCKNLNIQRQKASKDWIQIINPGVTSGPRRLGLPKDAPPEMQQAAAKAKAIADNLNRQYTQCINTEKKKAKIEIEKSSDEIAYAIALKKCQETRRRSKIDPCPGQIKREDFIQPIPIPTTKQIPSAKQKLSSRMPIKLFIPATILFGFFLLLLIK